VSPIVILVPGVCGSTLVNRYSSTFGFAVWLNYQRIVLGGMAMLELDAAGSEPEFPSIVGKIQSSGLLSSYYQIPYQYFSARARTLTFDYDWRMGSQSNGQLLATYLSNALKTNQVYLVCHSMGGLVGRVAESLLRTDVNYDNLLRVALLGTPNFGSFEAPKNLAGIPTWLDGTARIIAKSPAGIPYTTVVGYLSRVIAHWKSVMEMLPDGWSGPWQSVASVLAMYQSQSWNGVNTAVNQTLLNWGENFHKSIQPISNLSKYLCIVGYGQRTAVNLNEGAAFSDRNEYHYNEEGDGTVALLSSQLPGVQTVSIQVEHAAMPRNQNVLDFTWSGLTGQLQGNVVIN
jgi:hypothetical protein